MINQMLSIKGWMEKFYCFQNYFLRQFKILQKKMQNTYQPSSAHPLSNFQESSSLGIRRENKKATLLGCQKGDFQKALENVKRLSNRYQGGQAVSINPDVQYFKKFGTGIYLFFHFAKKLAILFTIIGLISLAPIIFNFITGDAYGGMISSFGVYIAQTTVGNLSNNPIGATTLDESTSNKYKMANAIPNLVISMLVLAFYIYWEVKSDKLSEEIKEAVRFQCHYTVEVVEFPENATEKDIEGFFSQFGKIKQVASVQNYSQLIDMAKDIYELQNQSKTKNLMLQSLDNEQEKAKYIIKINQANSKICHLQKQFLQIYKKNQLSIIKFFVIFEDLESRQKAIKTMKSYNKCCSWGLSHIPEEHLLKGEKVIVNACHNQPADILWQNQHIALSSTILRVFTQGILLILAIIITFFVISLINIVTPSTSTTLNVSAYDASSILSVTNSTILYVWCIQNQDFMDTLPSIDKLCDQYITKYYVNLVIGILISFVIVGVKLLLKKIVIGLAKFQKYKGQTEQSLCITRNLFLTYLSTTVLITLLLQAQLFGYSFKQLIGKIVKSDYLAENLALLQEYKDFVSFWYVDIGYKITMTWIILAFQAPLVEPLLCLITEKLGVWLASKELTQNSMQKKLTPPSFQIEDHYANILLLLFVGLAFSPGMPIILIPCAAGFVLRYFYFKIIFIRFSKIPEAYDEALNESITNYFPILLFIHFVFGIWIYSSSNIFTKNESFFSSLINSSSEATQQLGQFLRRFGSTWYYSIAFLLFLAIVIIKIFFYDLIYENIKNGESDQVPITVIYKVKSSEDRPQQTGNSNFTAEGQQRSLTSSYKIENNPNYYQILAIMNRLKLSA